MATGLCSVIQGLRVYAADTMLNVAGHCDRRGNRQQSLTSVIKCSGPEVMLLLVHWSKLVSALPNRTWRVAELLILLLELLAFYHIRSYSAFFSSHYLSHLCAFVHGIPLLYGMFCLDVSFHSLLLVLEGLCQFSFSLTNPVIFLPYKSYKPKATCTCIYYLTSI